MKTKILYFPGISDEEAGEAYRTLEDLAKSLGYITISGPDTGKGNIRTMLLAIARGEIVLTKRGQDVDA